MARKDRAAFRSVILAGVYDIKNLKQKSAGMKNIATIAPGILPLTFQVSLSFSALDIEGMLTDYERDCHKGMDIKTVSRLIYDYTSAILIWYRVYVN